MSQADLNKSLSDLRAEMDRVGVSDPKLKQRLAELISDLERQAGRAGAHHERAGLKARLSQVIAQFEVEHPDITASLGRVMSALAAMGI